MSEDASQLPTANQGVQCSAVYRQQFAGTHGEFVESRPDDSVSNIERRRAVVAGEASIVLREQDIVALNTDTARIIQRLCEGIRADQVEAATESASSFDTEGVVIAGSLIMDVLDPSHIRERGPETHRGAR